ncbi:MAG TPA: hypothetical protein VFC44_26650 [Candidatus Saccharimonadales bacterium]|nr:hypothetical protein [Candidatus Saccharimonadales bacterium]
MLITDGQVPIMPRSLLAVTNNDATLQDREMGALEGHSGAAIAVDGLTPVAALEQILAVAAGGVNEQALAEGLLSKFGTLSNVLAAADQELLGFNGMTAEALKLLRLVAWVREHCDDTAPATLKSNSSASVQPAASPQFYRHSHPIPSVQSEIPLNMPGQTELRLPEKPPQRERRTIQDALIAEGLMALKAAQEAKTTDELQELLLKRLGQNSMETRTRYARSVISWFFPDGVQGLLPRAWQAYQDEGISTDLLRWSYLNEEPIMGRCVSEALFPCENGLAMPATYFDRFLQDCLAEAPPAKTRERLKMNLKRIGFLDRARGKPDRLLPVVPQKTSLLLLLHHLFAAKAVRTVELRNLFTNPFWKYLGYKSEDAVRAVLREADAAGLIGKYVVADQLEQVTTCFTLDEILGKKARL